MIAPEPNLSRSLGKLRAMVGQEVLLGKWEIFTQAEVTAYGSLTGEDLWIHTDVARAAGSQFGSTIVQASLLMARFGSWIHALGVWLPEPATPLNYGYDRVRVLGALPVGQKIRGSIAVLELTESHGRVRMKLGIEAFTPDARKPVISAQWIIMFLLPT